MKARLTPATFFAIRTPLLPFDTLLAWSRGLAAPNAEPAELAQALQSDRVRLRARLADLVARPEVREAIFVASPSLEREIAHWRDFPTSERGERTERALVRYVARMCGRATPFGLFAGCGVGSVDTHTHLPIPTVRQLRRRTRLDRGFIADLTGALSADRELQRSLRYRTNDSLYEAAGRLRYFEVRAIQSRRSYHLVSVEPSEALAVVLRCADSGTSFNTLVEALVASDSEATLPEATDFIHELIDAQLVVDDLAPPVLGDPGLARLVDALGDSAAGRSVGPRLRCAEAKLRALDKAGLGQAPECYAKIIAELEALPVRPDRARALQVDLIKPGATMSLSGRHVREILRGAELLRRFSQARRLEPIERFKSRFRARFEEREIPLLVALDEDAGVGFDAWDVVTTEQAPLLEGLPFARRGGENSTAFRGFHAVLLRRLQRAQRDGVRELQLENSDLEAMEDGVRPPHPAGSAVLATLLAPAGSAADFRVFVRAVVGSSGASLLARFADADLELAKRLEEQVKLEEAAWPEALFAEIAHLPAGRASNILLRPRLRSHELCILGRSQTPSEGQLSLADLLVSVRDERVVLRSRSHDREVIPCLTSAHNFGDRSNISVYRFLSSLQLQGVVSGVSWDWGPLSAAEFLPRVVHDRVVLARARWRFDADQLEPFSTARGGDALFQATQALRRSVHLPRFVLLTDGDQELPVDLDNTLSVDAFASLLGQRAMATVEEMFPGTDELVARGPEGGYVHELIVPFVAAPPPRKPLDRRPVSTASIAARCPPGSDWLYAKLSCGPCTADRVLREAAIPVAHAALRTGAATSWFFVRYDDPHWHVRLRVCGNPSRLHSEVQPALERASAPLLENGAMWRLEFDTYERELERYGGAAGMLAAEAIFWADSETVASLLSRLPPSPAADARWQAVLLGMAALLDDFELTDTERRSLLRALRDAFAKEFPTPGDVLARSIADLHRRRRADLEAILDPSACDGLSAIREALRVRSARIAPAVQELRALALDGGLTRPLPHIIAALLHMHANRWIAAAARAHELVLYDFLERTFDSRVARRKAAAS